MSNALGAGAPGAGDQSGGFMQWLAGLPAAAQASIMRSMNYANPASVAPTQMAASAQGTPNPLTNPTPVSPALQGGGLPVPPSLAGNVGSIPIGGGPGMAMQSPTGIVPGGGSSGGGGASGAFPIGGGPGMATQSPTGTPNPTPWFTPSNTPYAPNPAAAAPIPPPRPVAQPAVARGGGKGVSPRMRAQAPAAANAAAASSPFTTVAAQNQDWSGGALSRYPLGARQGTALDLSKLFSRS